MPITLPNLPEQDPSDHGPFVVIAKHRAVPGTADQLEKRMLFDLANTRAEHGCLQFHIHRDRADRDLFVIYEVWRDVAALKRNAIPTSQCFIPPCIGPLDVVFRSVMKSAGPTTRLSPVYKQAQFPKPILPILKYLRF